VQHHHCRAAAFLPVLFALAPLLPGAGASQQRGTAFGSKDPGLFNLD